MDWFYGYNDAALQTGSSSVSDSSLRVQIVYVVSGVISKSLQKRNEKVNYDPYFFVDHMLGWKHLLVFIDITVIDRCNKHEQNKEDVAVCHIFQSLSLTIRLWGIWIHERIKNILWDISIVGTAPSRQSWRLRPLTNSSSIDDGYVLLSWDIIIYQTVSSVGLIRGPDIRLIFFNTGCPISFPLSSLEILNERIVYVRPVVWWHWGNLILILNHIPIATSSTLSS